jgi:hypothetical protein
VCLALPAGAALDLAAVRAPVGTGLHHAPHHLWGEALAPRLPGMRWEYFAGPRAGLVPMGRGG